MSAMCEKSDCEKPATWIIRGVDADLELSAICVCDQHVDSVRHETYHSTLRRLNPNSWPDEEIEDGTHPVRQVPPQKPKRVYQKKVKCRCGCGRGANWPHDGRPLFYARLCAYNMMVKQIRDAEEKKA